MFRGLARLRPESGVHLACLGRALERRGRADDARAARDAAVPVLRARIRLRPDDSRAHSSLGTSLGDRGRRAESEAEYREAIRLKPDFAEAHANLGNALAVRGRPAEAEAAYREAIRLQPDYTDAHYNLGITLSAQGQTAEAEAAYREAIRFRPDFAEAHCNLGSILRRSGRYAESLEEFRRGHELGSRQPGWRYPSAVWVRESERFVAMADRLSAILKGDDRPRDTAERLALAEICHDTKRLATSVRFWTEAFADDPKLADDLDAGHRYNAARAAAPAGCGVGRDDPMPDDAAQTKFRHQALDWLKADLAARAARLDAGARTGPALVTKLRDWQNDADLAGVRDPEALAKLPEAERKDWQALWADVDALLKRAGTDPRSDVKLP